MTTCVVLPEICDPDFVILLETITAMYAGNGPAGGELLPPGSVVQSAPQEGGVAAFAKPLNEAGAAPPLRTFTFDHCDPQNVTEPVAVLSPTTKPPPPPGADAYTIT